MAPIALILGSIGGTISAILGWVVFGLGIWGAVQVYFMAALLIAAGLIGIALLRPAGNRESSARGTATVQRI